MSDPWPAPPDLSPWPSDFRETLLSLGFTFVRALGNGCEGTVYAARGRDGALRVVKIFNEWTVREINHGCRAGLYGRWAGPSVDRLRLLAGADPDIRSGLYPIKLLETAQGVVGLHYPYEQLIKPPWRRLWPEGVRAAKISAFCRAQAYLLQHLQVAIADSDAMLTRQGQFRFVDYGPMIVPSNDFRCLEEHYADLSFFSFLGGVYLLKGTKDSSHVEPASLDAPSPYWRPEWLGVLRCRNSRLASVLADLADKPASIFLNPQTYMRMGAMLPLQVSPLQVGVFRCLGFLDNRLRESIRPLIGRANGRSLPRGVAEDRST